MESRAQATFAGIAAAVLSAILYAWCFPPTAQRWLAWVALAPLLVVVRRTSLARALGVTWLWTIVLGYRLNDWFPPAVSEYFQQGPLLGIALFLGVCTFTGGIEFMAFAACYRRLAERRRHGLPAAAAAAWVGAELVRSTLLGGDPWALLGYSQVGILPLMQIADVTGVYGIGFVVAGVNVVLAEAWMALGSRARLMAVLRGAVPVAAAGVAVVAYGVARLEACLANRATLTSVEVVSVQGNLDVGAQWREELFGANLDAYLALTADALAGRPSVALVVWPESAMTFLLEDEPAFRDSIRRTLAPTRAHLVAGGPHAALEVRPRYHNSAFVVSDGGDILGRYDKEHLLPFAERFPFGSIALLRRHFGRVREFTPGEPSPPLTTRAGRAGVLICNEAMIPGPAARRAGQGAEFLVNLANDSWLGDPKFSEPIMDMAIMRAVEQRRDVVRASTAGPSGVIDACGRVTARSPQFAQAVVYGELRARTDRTVYGRTGDVFAVICGLCALVGAFSPFPKRGPRSNAPPPSSAAAPAIRR